MKDNGMRKIIAGLLLCVLLIGFGATCGAKADSRTINANGNSVTVTTEDISHAAVINYHPTLDCHGKTPGSKGHVCCYFYAELLYKKIWGSTGGADLLRNIPADQKRITADNLKKYLSAAAPGAHFRVGVKTDGSGYGAHSMMFLSAGADGATFWEGNYDGTGRVRINYFSWSSLASYLSGKNYIVFIKWPGAPEYEDKYAYYHADGQTGIYRVTAGDGSVHQYPYAASPTVGTKNVGSDLVEVVELVANKLEKNEPGKHIWARLSDGSFIFTGNIEFQFRKVRDLTPISVPCTQKDVKKEPFAAAENLRLLSGNENVTLTAQYTNKYGNTWYEVQGGGFVNENNIETVPMATGVTKPTGNLPKGQGFGVGGTIFSSIKITAVTALVKNRTSGATEFTITVNTDTNEYKFGINGEIDAAMRFRTLNDGYYHYQVSAKTDSELFYMVIESDFTIGDPAGVTATPPTAANVTKPTGSLPRGQGFGVGADIASETAITAVTARVINRTTNAVMFELTVTPNAPSYSFGINGDIDKAMKFRTLEDGHYKYEVIAANAAGSYPVIESEFDIVGPQEDSPLPPEISNVTMPSGTLPKGQGFGVGATITSVSTITQVSARVTDRSSGAVMFEKTVAPNATVYSFGINSDIDKAMRFRDLNDGYYKYVITATNGAGTFKLVDGDFITGAPALTEDAPQVVNAQAPQGVFDQGFSFDVGGTAFSCLTNISAVYVEVIDEDTKECVASYVANPQSTDYTAGTDITGALNFGDLPAGRYSYEVTVENGVSTYTAVQSDFEIRSAAVLVEQIAVEAAASVALGETISFRDVQVLPENADNKTVLWSSLDPRIASQQDDGVFVANSVGTVTILGEAQDGSGVTASCNVTVACSHPETRTEIVRQATETEEGLSEIICTKCGEKVSEQAIPKLDPAVTETPAATEQPTPEPTDAPAPTEEPAPARLPGDVNGDGERNIMDVIRLLKYVSDWDVKIEKGNADVTGDQNVNIMDVIRLLKFVSGWKVELN